MLQAKALHLNVFPPLEFRRGFFVPVSFEELQEVAAINSEIRFIALELMKISLQTGVPFERVLGDFRKNAFKVKKFLSYPQATADKRRH